MVTAAGGTHLPLPQTNVETMMLAADPTFSTARVTISLTTFITYAATTGRTKVATVVEAKKRYAAKYAKETDFWLPLRNAIMMAHEHGRSLATLDALLSTVHATKIPSYTDAIAGYKKWVGKAVLTSGGARRLVWTHGDLTVNVNPELDVPIGGRRHLVKLYFNKVVLSKTQLDLSLRLLQTVVPAPAEAAILDGRRAKLHIATRGVDAAMDALLEAEGDALVKLWRRI